MAGHSQWVNIKHRKARDTASGGSGGRGKMLALSDSQEELDDLQEVHTRADFSAEILAQLQGDV